MALNRIGAARLKDWLQDGAEIALLDLREEGEFGEAHLFAAVPLPYSRLESRLFRLVPRRSCRLLLCDDGVSGVAERAAACAARYGYSDIHLLDGGVPAWEAAGFTLFAGVNVPSKTFGELMEHAENVPVIAAAELQSRRSAGENIIVIDGRPIEEYRKMNIPGSLCCPNGELALRIGEIAPDPATTIVINCAGRTRSIMGTALLRDFGLPNQVFALENGTMGWRLAGFALDHGSDRLYPPAPGGEALDRLTQRASALARERGISFVTPQQVLDWRADPARSCFLLDVRSPGEFAADGLRTAISAPGGQLLQATDQWIGVRGARIVLCDDNGIRASLIAHWLRALGHEAHVLAGGVSAARPLLDTAPPDPLEGLLPTPAELSPAELAQLSPDVLLIDIRRSMDYRASHIEGAIWASRARPGRLETLLDSARPEGGELVLIAPDALSARAFLADPAFDVSRHGLRLRGIHCEGPAAWSDAGLRLVTTPYLPPDADCIDYLFFVHDRHDGNLEAARRYLAWEMGLVAKLDAAELARFRLSPVTAGT